jgi:hypothetical protein
LTNILLMFDASRLLSASVISDLISVKSRVEPPLPITNKRNYVKSYIRLENWIKLSFIIIQQRLIGAYRLDWAVDTMVLQREHRVFSYMMQK